MAKTGGAGGVSVAILITTVGGMLAYSAFKGIAITDVLSGAKGNPLDPAGGKPADSEATDLASLPGLTSTPPGGKIGFQGPRASLLESLAATAQTHYHLTITSTFSGNHVPGSYHFRHRAFDCSGSEADMHSFCLALVNDPSMVNDLAELIHNPGFAVKDGHIVNPAVFAAVWAGHKNHVHVAA